MPAVPIVVPKATATEVKERLRILLQTNPDADPSKVLGRRFLECVTAFAVGRAHDDKTLFEIEHLIETGADLNIPDDAGFRAVHFAGAYGSPWLARRLIDSKRCDVLVRTLKGDYPFQLAREWSRDRGVANLLEKVQCRQAFERGVPAYVVTPTLAELFPKWKVAPEFGGEHPSGPAPSL